MSHHLDIENTQTQDTVTSLKEQAAEKASHLKEQATEKASHLKEKASEAVAQLSDRAHEMASGLNEKTDRSLHMIGEKMTSVAGTLREKQPGMAAVADRLEASGQFLTENGVNEIKQQAAGMIKQHPVEAMVVGMGIGILIGSLLSARRTR